ncbi:MAG: hypothetical protein EHM15_04955 [Desulfobacteraceae bacterium]|nr:MAG: hypothetical protein EHM15_04955 [Desulfobacteraceae bacterium]
MATASRSIAHRPFAPLPALLLLLVCLAVALSGCATAKKSVDKVAEASRDAWDGVMPRKGSAAGRTVVLLGVDAGLPGVQPGFPADFSQRFPPLVVKECAGLRFDAGLAAGLKAPPRIASGLIDGYALAMIGRRQGVDFFLVGTLMDVKLEEEPTGFWLWKDTRYWIRAVMRLEIVDSATGAKILDESLKEELEIDSLQYESLQQSQTIRLADFQPAMERMLQNGARRVCQTLRERPWQAFIVAADAGGIELSAGSASGLAAGRVLEVFGLGPVMTSKDGQRFIPIGEKLGEATVSEVTPDSARARFDRWEAVQNGGTVRMKK